MTAAICIARWNWVNPKAVFSSYAAPCHWTGGGFDAIELRMAQYIVRASRLFAPSLFAFALLGPQPALANDGTMAEDTPEPAAKVTTETFVLTGDNSRPDWQPVTTQIPAPRDIIMSGVMSVQVDTKGQNQGILSVQQTMPITPASIAKNGEMVILFPNWLPGNHAPRGEMDKVANLTIHADGTPVAWRRDPLEIHAIRFTPPKGARDIDITFDFLSATVEAQGRVVATPEILNLRWMQLSFYPAGYYARGVAVDASLTLPDGWQLGTALEQTRPACVGDGCAGPATVFLERTDYDTLVDSPIFAGKFTRKESLSDKVDLFIVADEAKYLEATDAQIEPHRALVREARALYGSEPFDKYTFLLSLSDRLGGIGLEHHRSSENGVEPDYFTGWDEGPGRRNLLPHEYVHSWNGKHRRPNGLFSPISTCHKTVSCFGCMRGRRNFGAMSLVRGRGCFRCKTRSIRWPLSPPVWTNAAAANGAPWSIPPPTPW